MLDGHHVHIPKIPRSEYNYSQVKRLIDVDAKLREGKGKGYMIWAERNNIDAKAQSIIFLKEHNIGSVEELEDQINVLRSDRNKLYAAIREKKNRMKEINELRQAIRDYRRTKDVYAQYKASGWSPKFYNEHRQDIESHKKSQAVYSSVDGKMPTLKELSTEYDTLKAEKETDDATGSKVNACINNIFRIWQDGADERLTQLVFCDISTPKGMERTAQQTEQPEASDAPKEEDDLPPLEPVDDLMQLAGVSSNAMESNFNVYEDIRSKLIARGVPPEEIAFIHDANTEVKKKELFAKVRAGQVRVLLGSTAKMGAGTNCQDRLIALHDLDCPWRPGDLEQRSGRIVRQGNMNPDVQIYSTLCVSP